MKKSTQMMLLLGLTYGTVGLAVWQCPLLIVLVVACMPWITAKSLRAYRVFKRYGI